MCGLDYELEGPGVNSAESLRGFITRVVKEQRGSNTIVTLLIDVHAITRGGDRSGTRMVGWYVSHASDWKARVKDLVRAIAGGLEPGDRLQILLCHESSFTAAKEIFGGGPDSVRLDVTASLETRTAAGATDNSLLLFALTTAFTAELLAELACAAQVLLDAAWCHNRAELDHSLPSLAATSRARLLQAGLDLSLTQRLCIAAYDKDVLLQGFSAGFTWYVHTCYWGSDSVWRGEHVLAVQLDPFIKALIWSIGNYDIPRRDLAFCLLTAASYRNKDFGERAISGQSFKSIVAQVLEGMPDSWWESNTEPPSLTHVMEGDLFKSLDANSKVVFLTHMLFSNGYQPLIYESTSGRFSVKAQRCLSPEEEAVVRLVGGRLGLVLNSWKQLPAMNQQQLSQLSRGTAGMDPAAGSGCYPIVINSSSSSSSSSPPDDSSPPNDGRFEDDDTPADLLSGLELATADAAAIMAANTAAVVAAAGGVAPFDMATRAAGFRWGSGGYCMRLQRLNARLAAAGLPLLCGAEVATRAAPAADTGGPLLNISTHYLHEPGYDIERFGQQQMAESMASVERQQAPLVLELQQVLQRASGQHLSVSSLRKLGISYVTVSRAFGYKTICYASSVDPELRLGDIRVATPHSELALFVAPGRTPTGFGFERLPFLYVAANKDAASEAMRQLQQDYKVWADVHEAARKANSRLWLEKLMASRKKKTKGNKPFGVRSQSKAAVKERARKAAAKRAAAAFAESDES